MKFKYRKIPDTTNPPHTYISLPLLQVTLFHGSNHHDVLCLLDSGADECMFHTSIANLLGIDVKSGRPKTHFGIAGQSIDSYMHTIQLQVQGFNERIELEAAFTDANQASLIGQRGFFDNYRVTFEKYRGRFEIKSRTFLHAR
jgi:hypothetical protein